MRSGKVRSKVNSAREAALTERQPAHPHLHSSSLSLSLCALMSIVLSRSSIRVGNSMARLANRLVSNHILATKSHHPAALAVWGLVSRRSSGAVDHQTQMPQPLHEAVRDRPDLEVSEYWGIAPKEFHRKDGSQWPWHSFKPSDTYTANMKIDIKRHYPPESSFVDKVALKSVKTLRVPVDFFFKNHHVSHALLLETVAGVPGMVGGMLLHLRSLRRFEHSGGWIKALLDEAENERMHLMTWVDVMRPRWWERALVLLVQGGFFNAYFLLYLVSPRLAHRFVGYLEEEAVHSYTYFLEAIDKGEMANGPAPLIAIDYWRLPKNATIRDVVLVIRADEAHHRDVNHFAADVYREKRELSRSPAPIGYH